MPRIRIGDAGPETNAFGMRGEKAEAGIDLAVEPLIGEPHRVVAAGLGQLDALDHARERRVSQHQKFDGHVALTPLAISRLIDRLRDKIDVLRPVEKLAIEFVAQRHADG